MTQRNERIEFIREKCLGDAICTAIRPDIWYMDSDGKASMKPWSVESDDPESLNLAAKLCPASIIRFRKL